MKLFELSFFLSSWEKEYKFHPDRRWRFDWADPKRKIAVEYEGGITSKGRHTRITGYTKDCEKYNQASLMGWIILRYTVLSDINSAILEIERAVSENKEAK